ncbi:hypothetical protein NMY22_g12818 [Coprinellus aureogranulatus]|nr:hypothetical protein NMY22_g12818 [Coprinellus aureogranulatus]
MRSLLTFHGRVIEEGQELERERRKWKQQASSSIGNTRARTLSRTRSKSLTQKGRQGGHRTQTSFDYLAARACLGSQNLTPVLPARSHTVSFSKVTGALSSVGRSSHTQSNSISKSKSSQTHSRGHSKNDSWANSVAKSGKNVSPAIATHAEQDDKLAGLEGVLRRDETRVMEAPAAIVQPIDHPYGNAAADRVHQRLLARADIRMFASPPRPCCRGMGLSKGERPCEDRDWWPSPNGEAGSLSPRWWELHTPDAECGCLGEEGGGGRLVGRKGGEGVLAFVAAARVAVLLPPPPVELPFVFEVAEERKRKRSSLARSSVLVPLLRRHSNASSSESLVTVRAVGVGVVHYEEAHADPAAVARGSESRVRVGFSLDKREVRWREGGRSSGDTHTSYPLVLLSGFGESARRLCAPLFSSVTK